jgi:nitrogen regulatory protein PII
MECESRSVELLGKQEGSAMSASIETAKIKLVTIICGEELLDGIEEHLKTIGPSGYTVGRVDGRGQHGPRTRGFLDRANVRIEVLLRPSDAPRLLERLMQMYEGRQVVAFSQDVEAVPKEHFA